MTAPGSAFGSALALLDDASPPKEVPSAAAAAGDVVEGVDDPSLSLSVDGKSPTIPVAVMTAPENVLGSALVIVEPPSEALLEDALSRNDVPATAAAAGGAMEGADDSSLALSDDTASPLIPLVAMAAPGSGLRCFLTIEELPSEVPLDEASSKENVPATTGAARNIMASLESVSPDTEASRSGDAI